MTGRLDPDRPMSERRSTWRKFKRGVQILAFASPLYPLTLGGRAPAALAVVPPNPWPGDAARGARLIGGEYAFAGQTAFSDVPHWMPEGADRRWLATLHGFGWLRDLRAVGGDAGRRHARLLVADWIDHNSRWHGVSWAPDIMGVRIANWIGQHDFYCSSADDLFRARVFDSLARQARHLGRVLPGSTDGARLLLAIKGLTVAGVCLPGGEPHLAIALRLLDRELPRQILPDGGHVERNPSIQVRVLRDLVDLRATLSAGRKPVPAALQHAIDRLAPALRFFRHGDGGLALFNGSREEDASLIDSVLAQADARGRPQRSAPHSGFERMMAGRVVVLMDTGAHPPAGLDRDAHAGTLSFEMSVGRERLIVNCGAHPSGDEAWRRALSATAAHSTTTVGETNSAEIVADGGLGRRPSKVLCQRREQDGAMLVDASHDGYLRAFGIVHHRRLYLGEGGEDVRGEDLLTGPAGWPFAVRFHLHPDVTAAPSGESGVVLQLPSGAAWGLRASGGALDVAESVYLGTGSEPRRTTQIVVAGQTGNDGATVKWALRRERNDG